MKNLSIHHAENEEMAAKSLGKHVIKVLTNALYERGNAFLVVSGGSTPKPLFEYLAQQQIDWKNVTVTLADERCVETTDTASNAKLVTETLLTGFAADARFVRLFDGGMPHVDDQISAGLRLLGLPRYDMVILGMGDDGHTASIFPQASNRDQALGTDNLRLALLTDPVTVEPMRITQSAARLLHTRNLVIHFTGNQKANLFNEILHKPDPAQWPLSAFVTQNQVALDVFTDAQIMEGVAA